MDTDRVEVSLADELQRRNDRPDEVGKYHPSEITGCPLKVVLNKVTGNETILNCWLFQGSAVHYYLQESGILDNALHEAGYHAIDTQYEVNKEYRINDEVVITGTCDILCNNGDDLTIFDIKYSSVKPSSGRERIYKYFAQVNTYAFMFGADEYALMMINSRSDDLLGAQEGSESDINVLPGTPKQDNWDIVQDKAVNIHEALMDSEYEGGAVVQPEEVEIDSEIMDTIMSQLDEGNIPSYSGECKYCDHKEYCPDYQGETGMFSSFNSGG